MNSARLHREWAACAGLTLVLAALVLWGATGPAIRVLIMYAVSGGLVALGVKLERKSEALQNYGRLVIAGGLAAAYFTTYAAHYFRPISIFGPAWLAVLLLIACAGLMAGFANRRQSQWLGTLAIFLAWFAATIHPLLPFTLGSNLILVLVAVWFLVRNGWTVTAFVALIAVYLGFLIWWPYSAGRLDPDRYMYLREFWISLGFFMAYWALFAKGGLLATDGAFPNRSRLGFATLNNALFYGCGILILPPRYPDWFWKFTAAFGGALLIASVFVGTYSRLRRGYRVQGILLITLAIVSAVAGREPATMLALASTFFVLMTEDQEQWPLQYAAYATAALAIAFAWEPVHRHDTSGLATGLLTGGLLVVNACWIHHHREAWWRWTVGYFAALGLFIWLVARLSNTPEMHQSPALALEAVILTASFAFLAVREIPYLAKGFLLAAQIVWFMQIGSFVRPWWNPLLVVLATLGISYWWQTRGRTHMPAWELRWVQGISAAVAVAILLLWLDGDFGGRPMALVLMSLLALGSLKYSLAIRDWFLAGFSQLFTATAIGEFIGQLSHAPTPNALAALLPIPVLVVQAQLIRTHVTDADWTKPAHWLAVLYRLIATAMFVVWVVHYIGPANRFLLLAFVAFLLLLGCIFNNSRDTLPESLICGTGALLVFWFGYAGAHGFWLRDLYAFILLLGYGVLGRRSGLLPQIIQEIGIIVGLVSVWRWVSLWAQFHFPALPLAVVWSVLAVIVICVGWWLNERLYRAVGWAIHACALVRLMAVDMRVAADFRLGLLIVGTAFLTIGFSYARRPREA